MTNNRGHMYEYYKKVDDIRRARVARLFLKTCKCELSNVARFLGGEECDNNYYIEKQGWDRF